MHKSYGFVLFFFLTIGFYFVETTADNRECLKDFSTVEEGLDTYFLESKEQRDKIMKQLSWFCENGNSKEKEKARKREEEVIFGYEVDFNSAVIATRFDELEKEMKHYYDTNIPSLGGLLFNASKSKGDAHQIIEKIEQLQADVHLIEKVSPDKKYGRILAQLAHLKKQTLIYKKDAESALGMRLFALGVTMAVIMSGVIIKIVSKW